MSHGGGPMPLLGTNPELSKFLRGYQATVTVPIKAIVIISAHWEEAVPSVTSAAEPPLLFDYGGFPPETYRYKYAAPGDPSLARRIAALVDDAGLGPAVLRSDRGWDHGVFVPLMLAFPEAATPVVAVSLVRGGSPSVHWQLGRALRPLRDESVLLIGSGSSFHNMRGFSGQSGGVKEASAAFDAYVTAACSADATSRETRLVGWEQAPHARDCHPPGGEEHLTPLFVVAGAAYDEERGARVYGEDNMMGKGITMSAWEFK